MSEQQSKKRGVKSEAQKTDETRDLYAPIASTSRTGGAFGKQTGDIQSDQDLALSQEEKRMRRQREHDS